MTEPLILSVPDESADFLLDFKRTLEITAAQWLSFSDEPDLDPLADFKRVLELTGERWLSFSEAVAMLCKREPMSIGQAEAIIDDFRKAYFADGRTPFDRQSGGSTAVRFHWFHDTDFLTNKPNRGNTFVSEADLIYWHDRNRTVPAFAAAEKPAEPQLAQEQKKKAGRPTEHDWLEGKLYFEKLWAEKGDPTVEANQVDGWRSYSDAAELVLAHMEKYTEKLPEQDTVRKKIAAWIKEFSAK